MLLTPEHAAKIDRLPAFRDPSLLHSLEVNQHSSPPFEARQIKNSGTGLVANRTVLRGEWLMSFTPAFVISDMADDDLLPKDRLIAPRLAFEQLPDSTRNISHALFGQMGGTTDPLDDILGTNSFALSLLGQEDNEEECGIDGKVEHSFSCLFPEISVRKSVSEMQRMGLTVASSASEPRLQTERRLYLRPRNHDTSHHRRSRHLCGGRADHHLHLPPATTASETKGVKAVLVLRMPLPIVYGFPRILAGFRRSYQPDRRVA